MKIKLNKIIFIIIFSLLSLLMLCSTVKATVTIDGTKYYAKGDIIWHKNEDDNSGYIEITNDTANGFYYCRKHGASLTGYLGNVDSLTLDVSLENWYESLSGAEEDIHKKEQEALVGTNWYPTYCNGKGSPTRRALKLDIGEWVDLKEDPKNLIKSRTEMALYAFANKFYEDYDKSSYVQRAVWQYIRKYENSKCKIEAETKLFEAAEYYATDWTTKDKGDIKVNKDAVKVRIIGKDYIVGPFNIEYTEATYDEINFSWLEDYLITDQNNKKIEAAEITNKDGKKIFGIASNGDKIDIPNGEDFYVKFPYNDTISQLNITENLKYIDGVTARKQDIETQAYNFGFTWKEDKKTASAIHHTAKCAGGERWEYEVNYAFCTSCNAGTTTVYKYEASRKSSK